MVLLAIYNDCLRKTRNVTRTLDKSLHLPQTLMNNGRNILGPEIFWSTYTLLIFMNLKSVVSSCF